MSNSPKVIDLVVNNDLCIGCGLCVYKCPSKALSMKSNELGFLIPEQIDDCKLIEDCISVCPFNINPKQEIMTESELANIFLKEKDKTHPQIGNYKSIYVGYSIKNRLTSSSGGIATFVLNDLLKRGIVSHVFSVKKGNEAGVHYEYAISSNEEELLQGSKTRYFPVTLADVFSKIDELEGNVAIVGVACFIKAIRLAQYSNPLLSAKIPFLVGIICGGVKSSFYTDYLSSKSGVENNEYSDPNYRIKNFDSSAGDYSFGCLNTKTNEQEIVKMRSVGDMWGTGLFKANACDFCDDVTTELADISVGDAWLNPYVKDGRGDNVVVCRSNLAELIIKEGIANKKLHLEDLPIEQFLLSQKGSFNHRHSGLPYRVKQAKKVGKQVPPKRYEKDTSTFYFKIVQYFRMRTRRKSLEIWKKNPDSIIFDKKIKSSLSALKKATRINHFMISLINKINRTK